MRAANQICRSAATSVETIVATVVLGIAVVVVGKFSFHTHQGLQQRDLSTHIRWEIANARETIGSWSAENITSQRIEGLPISSVIQTQLTDARWQVSLTDITEPVAAMRVQLALVGEYRGQTIRPSQLVFWVPHPASPAVAEGDVR